MKEPFFQCKTALPDQAFTHGAKFHSDDVFATAFLRLIKPEIQVTRGFEVPADFDGIVYDIGRGRFDHHQEDNIMQSFNMKFCTRFTDIRFTSLCNVFTICQLIHMIEYKQHDHHVEEQDR